MDATDPGLSHVWRNYGALLDQSWMSGPGGPMGADMSEQACL